MDKVYHQVDGPGESTEHYIEDDTLHVLTRTNHVDGNQRRRVIRDHDTYNDMGFCNEAFTFTEAEFAMLKKTQPQLFRDSAQDQRKAWVAFAQTIEGKLYRVK